MLSWITINDRFDNNDSYVICLNLDLLSLKAIISMKKVITSSLVSTFKRNIKPANTSQMRSFNARLLL